MSAAACMFALLHLRLDNHRWSEAHPSLPSAPLVTADHESFEQTESGASHTFPQAAGTIRKNGFMVIRGRPCKVRLEGSGRSSTVSNTSSSSRGSSCTQQHVQHLAAYQIF